jgi:prephenate dehydrogenase
MWRDIAIANKSALLNSIDLFSDHLVRLREAVQDENAHELFNTFDRAKQARDEFATLLAQRIQPKLP